MKQNERQWKQLGFDKDPQPTGFPWALVIRILLTVLSYLALCAHTKPERERFIGLHKELSYWNPAKGDKE